MLKLFIITLTLIVIGIFLYAIYLVDKELK